MIYSKYPFINIKHVPVYLFISINQLDALNFIISLFQASTCFEHMCSKHVEAWNKLIIKFSASSWLILRNNYIEVHGQQNIKSLLKCYMSEIIQTGMTCPLCIRTDDDFKFTVVRNQKKKKFSPVRGAVLRKSPSRCAHGCSLCGAVIRLFSPQLVSAGQATNALPWWQLHSTSVVRYVAPDIVGQGDLLDNQNMYPL